MSSLAGWRPMGRGDVAAVAAISDRVHGDYTEQPAIYDDRLRLYPAGCFLLERDGQALGYLITHPWAGDRPPALDRLIDRLPDAPDRYYLHDLALLPEARGTGAAAAAVDLIVAQARTAGFDRITLTAINGADAFWRRQDFVDLPVVADSYGADSVSMVRML
ncbi:GNAT family N-acetyltransferase [Sphingobium sp. AP49]|uniref:GNAT family N-acetyltransferase n=1 Tax=Sphingobium sp. AP49 TaxID=1144307 RepID=UPI00026EC846|nr:GNAT family N-acetyltransferase [Sphingobium sp. AP49]WHO40794.1 GNAT family N-acetyltransferase [Sphingobium sp. AP49]